MLATFAATAATSPDPSKLRTLLVSLTGEEWALFFPKGDLAERLPGDVRVVRSAAKSEEDFHAEIARENPEIIIGAWKTPMLRVPAEGLPCRYYCYLAGSVRRAVPRELIVRGLLVSNWGASIARYVAEAALALLLSALRNQTAHQLDIHVERTWRAHPESLFNRSLFGLRLGLHGLGVIAREFVPLVAPFSLRLSAFDPFADRAAAGFMGIRMLDTIDELFSENDAVVDFCALTEETRGVVTERLLRLLPPGGAFVNVARGAIADEAALARLAAEGRLNLGLDVFSEEPLPADSPLRGLRHATLTPHTSGKTLGGHEAAAAFGLANLRRHLRGEPPEGAISLTLYDRMT